jgi:protein-arginine kinase activator protein McsA
MHGAEKTMAKKTESPNKKLNRIGEVRCQNCYTRFRPPLESEKASCPECGWEWYISWVGKLAKIRKPVWESWDRQMAEAQPPEESE